LSRVDLPTLGRPTMASFSAKGIFRRCEGTNERP
jgi:hypothetical protein